MNRPPRDAPESGGAATSDRDRADPPGRVRAGATPDVGGERKPGINRWHALIGWLDHRIGTEDEALARRVLRAVVAGPLFDAFLAMVVDYRRRMFPPTVRRVKHIRIADPAVKNRIGEFPVAVISCRARSALDPWPGAASPVTRVVCLSAETAMKQVINHPDLTADHYRLLPNLIEEGYAVVEDGRNLIFFRRFGPRWYKAVVKQTARSELYLTTFRKANLNQVPSAARGP